MAARSQAAKASDLLERLEAAYGALVPSEDPIEAGLMALLAEHAPDLSRVQTRQLLREWVVDWNEMRVADPWDISNAIRPGGHAGARAFARAALRMLGSIDVVLNRMTFDRAVANPEVDVDALIDKLRGIPEHAKAVLKASLAAEGDWRLDKEALKVAQKLGLAGKTTSTAKVSKDLATAIGEADRLRGHYLLTRYAHRRDEDADPLGTQTGKAAKKAAAKADAEPTPKKAAAKPAARKPKPKAK